MKHHRIALDMAARRWGGTSAARLPILYDAAVARLENKESTSIKNSAPFEMRITTWTTGRDTGGETACKVMDLQSGQYVELLKPRVGECALEIGQIVSLEHSAPGQSSTRTW
jgi:hypothetical protein